MAERALADIITDSTGIPSMVAGTEEEAFVRFIDVRGPYKVETLYFQLAAADDFAANATHSSILAHPAFAEITPMTDLDGTAFPGSVDLTSDESNANFKQLTLRDCENIPGLGVLIKVYGF
jgi:hypothetical protein